MARSRARLGSACGTPGGDARRQRDRTGLSGASAAAWRLSADARRFGDPALDAGVQGQGRVRGRPAGNHDNGHGSHADHGGRLTHRRWPCTRWRQARNRTGTPSAYLIDGLVLPGVRPFPRPDPALACRIAARPAVPHRAAGPGGDAAPDLLRTCPAGAERDRRPSVGVPGLPAGRHHRARREGGSCRGQVAIPGSSARCPSGRSGAKPVGARSLPSPTSGSWSATGLGSSPHRLPQSRPTLVSRS